jgi:hypothetical protein
MYLYYGSYFTIVLVVFAIFFTNGGHLHVDFATIRSPVVQQQVCIDEENCGIVQTRAAVLHQTNPHFQNNYTVPRSERIFVAYNAT